ncbi:MAG: hypothetical protein HKN37_16310 [Rhodothermales bacterium]|nr:hypothetical protein [Rhodothermales bacterium]
MKTGLYRAAAVRVLGMCILLVATLVSPEAVAQGGRADSGRNDSNVRVERKKAGSRGTVASKRTVARNKVAARTVKQKQDRNRKVAGRGSTRTKTRSGDAVATRDRSRETKSRSVERRDRSRSGDAVAARDRNRETKSRSVERRNSNRSGDRGLRQPDRRTRTDRVDGRDRTGRANRTTDRRVKDRKGARSRYTGPKYSGNKSVRHLYDRRDRFYYHKRSHRARYSWCNVYHPAGHHHYANAHINIGSHVYLGLTWPWNFRYRYDWRPRFRYRQVVYIETGWGGRRRDNKVEVHTYYRHRILHADDRYSEVEIEIDAVDLYQNGRFLSTVDRIPGSLKKVRAIIHADGQIEFDRNLFIIGDAGTGFELIATRYYTDHLYNAYDDRHGFKVGRVDLRKGKVKKVRRSRFFDHGRFVGYAPISLLPDDDRLWDYGQQPVSDRYNNRGRETGWSRDYRGNDQPYYDGDYELSRDYLDSYQTSDGGEARLERATVVDRLN